MARTDERLSRYYARAFLAIALEMRGEDVLTELEEQFQKLAELTTGDTARFFQSPVFDSKEKAAVWDQFIKTEGIEPALGRLGRLLISERNLDLLPSIAVEYSEALQEARNEIKALVRTAFPLKPAERDRLKSALGRATGKKILMSVEVDPELIGGVLAEVDGTVFDASIRGFLQRLQGDFRT